jgi:hypothetical protein
MTAMKMMTWVMRRLQEALQDQQGPWTGYLQEDGS